MQITITIRNGEETVEVSESVEAIGSQTTGSTAAQTSGESTRATDAFDRTDARDGGEAPDAVSGAGESGTDRAEPDSIGIGEPSSDEETTLPEERPDENLYSGGEYGLEEIEPTGTQ